MTLAMDNSINPSVHTKITSAAALAGAVGVPGSFAAHADVWVLGLVWAGLFTTIADATGTTFTRHERTRIIKGVLAGAAAFIGGMKAATTVIAYTGVGTIPAMLANASINATFTYTFGMALYQVFSSKEKHVTTADLIQAIVVVMLTMGRMPNPSEQISLSS